LDKTGGTTLTHHDACHQGQEILSGRTRDTAVTFSWRTTDRAGINLNEVRVVSDDRGITIIAAVQALFCGQTYFTSGGIGLTMTISPPVHRRGIQYGVDVRDDARPLPTSRSVRAKS
jgi:hypothetical protein